MTKTKKEENVKINDKVNSEGNIIIQDNINDDKIKVEAHILKDVVVADEANETRELYDKGRYGEKQDNKTILYSLHEALYLVDRGKFEILDIKNKKINYTSFLKIAVKVEPNFWAQHCVYKDLRKRGYIVKTALKFGADFRVYDRGIKPGEDHAKWIVYPVSESKKFTWFEFSAKNRVAHSTKKRLLMGIVDTEGEPTYYEVSWTRP